MPRPKKYYDNDSGLAFGWMMGCLYLAVAVLVWLSYSWVFNNFLAIAVNPAIAEGSVSLQTANAIDWNINVFRYAPPLFLILGFCWMINRAIFKRSTG